MEKNLNRSGGPNTPEGKVRSSQNSLNHGMCQERFFLLPGESQEEFDALLETWRKQYDMNEPAVPALVKTLTELDWMQQRCRYNICKLEMQLAEAEAADEAQRASGARFGRSEADARIDRIEGRLNNAYRYKTTAENSFQRALRALEKFRAIRKREEHTEFRLRLREKHIAFNVAYGFAKQGLPLPNLEDNKNGSHPEPTSR